MIYLAAVFSCRVDATFAVLKCKFGNLPAHAQQSIGSTNNEIKNESRVASDSQRTQEAAQQN
jgi:hypothetical protein